jgi:aspartate-semialdehyde dehydrogenase
MKPLKIAIVGATGLVGRTFLKIIENSFLPIESISLFATSRSAGTHLPFKDKTLIVEDVQTADFSLFDVALFSAGKDASKSYVPRAVEQGCLVIDNGSYWRMHPEVPLVVPEVNFPEVEKHNGIIANPNCSTIQLVVALNPIEKNFGLKRVEVATYQAISGAGQKGINKLLNEIGTNEVEPTLSKHPIAFNILFHSILGKYEFSEEEIKVMNETKKILGLPNLPISATCVRIPVLVSHCEAVSLETRSHFDLPEVEAILAKSEGIVVIDEPDKENYPTPREAKDTDFVYVGRIRRNPAVENGLLLWVVADNVRKGAALNAVQILEKMYKETPEALFKLRKESIL